MKVDIDISQKIEENKSSYLGMGGAYQASLVLQKREKQLLFKLTQQKEDKRRRKRRSKIRQIVRIYAILCFLLIKDMPRNITVVLVDRDYYGHSDEILGHLKNLMRNEGLDPYRIDFEFGDASKGAAHEIAKDARLGLRQSLEASAEEIMSYY